MTTVDEHDLTEVAREYLGRDRFYTKHLHTSVAQNLITSTRIDQIYTPTADAMTWTPGSLSPGFLACGLSSDRRAIGACLSSLLPNVVAW